MRYGELSLKRGACSSFPVFPPCGLEDKCDAWRLSTILDYEGEVACYK